MSLTDPQAIVERLLAFGRQVRDVVRASHGKGGGSEVAHVSSSDTIYAIDADVDPILIRMCEEWAKTTPLVLIAEGLHDENGIEGPRAFPAGTRPEACAIRLIVDPIDGTRGIMYDKRPAWCLMGVAPNRGEATRLRDIDVAVMVELPTSKMGFADVLWAIKGEGAHGRREDLLRGTSSPLSLKPSGATKIDHGFASVSNFFPGTKVAASELMEFIVHRLIGKADVTRATIFDDQYISTGGQFYELIVGHDRFNCDVRPLFYRMGRHGSGLCVHPYDCCTALIAMEAGVILTDGLGQPLDGPLDALSDITWAGFANREIHRQVEPLIIEFFRTHGAQD
jgi:fructose-1,6-bisphosphatase/inositol monophosphatase family enzyme